MTSLQSERPALPRWRLDRDEHEALRLYRKVLLRWMGERLTTEISAVLMDDLSDAMELRKSEQLAALADTLLQYHGLILDMPTLRRMAMQCTCNRKMLEDGQPLRRFTGVLQPEWVPFQIVDLQPCQFGAKPGMQLDLLVIGGAYAGFPAEKKCPTRFLARMAYDIGFSKRLLYDEPSDLLGLKFAGYILPTQEPELHFEYYAITSPMARENRQTIKQRKEEE